MQPICAGLGRYLCISPPPSQSHFSAPTLFGCPQHLRQIWDLSDADNDNKLSMAEFCVGMHLIVCVSKKGLAIPTSLPRSLAPSFVPSPNGSSGAPVLQSPSRRIPAVQPLSTPPSGRGFSSLGAAGTDLGDAFRQVSR